MEHCERVKFLEGLNAMSEGLTALGTLYSEEGKQEAAAIAAGAAGIMCSLVLIDRTLEEIRDAIRGEK